METAFRIVFCITMATWLACDVHLIYLMLTEKRAIQEYFWVQIIRILLLIVIVLGVIFILPPGT